MSKTKISQYSTTNSDNTDIEGINIAENCPPSNINNAIREVMVHLKEFQTGASGDPLTIAGNFAVSGAATFSNTVAFSGTATAPTASPGTNTTQIATTAFATASATAALSTLGTISTQNANNVTITGGTVSSTTLSNNTVTNYTESSVDIGTVTSSHTINLTNGTVQIVRLTANTTCTFTMPTATAGKSFILFVRQAATTGNGNATFTGVKWSAFGTPTITATANRMDIFTFVADGTSWYGSFTQGYTL
jgi:hypothetical protein